MLIILLLISSCANFVMHKYGIFIDSNMVRNLFETNTREALDFFTIQAVLNFILTGLFPSIFIFFCKIEYKPFLKETKQRVIFLLISILCLGVIAAISYKEYATFGRNNKKVN